MFSPSGTDKEETGWTDKRTRGFVQLCGEQQAHLHGKGETEGRAAVTLEVKARIDRGGVYTRSFPFGDAQMLNRLTKSAEAQARLDEEYFKINMEGHQMRLKLENTLKNCHQVGKGASLHRTATQILRRLFLLECSFTYATSPATKQSQSTSLHCSRTHVRFAAPHVSLSGFQIILELEKQRVEVLCNSLKRYNLQMSSFGQTLNHVRTSESSSSSQGFVGNPGGH